MPLGDCECEIEKNQKKTEKTEKQKSEKKRETEETKIQTNKTKEIRVQRIPYFDLCRRTNIDG